MIIINIDLRALQYFFSISQFQDQGASLDAVKQEHCRESSSINGAVESEGRDH